MAGKMDSKLRTIMVEAKVAEETILWFEDKDCLDITTFSNWVENKSELVEELDKVVHDSGLVDEPLAAFKIKVACTRQASALKQAWRECEVLNEAGLKQKQVATVEPEIDAPLDSEVFEKAKSTFKQYYKWGDFDARRIGNAKLFGRTSREFHKKKITLVEMMKVRSRASATKTDQAPKERTRLPGTNIVVEQGVEIDDDPTGNLINWLAHFDILANTWATTGCFDATYTPKGEQMPVIVKYANWFDVDAYRYEFVWRAQSLRAKHTEASIFAYWYSVEEVFRLKAIEFATSEDEVPWGAALRLALKDQSHLWNENRHILSGNRETAIVTHPQDMPLMPSTAPHYSGPLPQKGGGKSHKSAFIGSTMPCRFYNTQAGCRMERCTFAHICNVKDANGHLCKIRNCNRTTHGGASSGAAAAQKRKNVDGKGSWGSSKRQSYNNRRK